MARIRGRVEPEVTVAAVADQVDEGADAWFTVTRTGVTTGALTVSYSVSETGDMVASGEEGAKTVAFADGDTEQTVTVPTVEDSVHEADSTVTLTLTADAAYELGTDATAEVTVEDDDAPTVTVSAAPVSPATANDYTLSANRVLTVAAGATTSTGAVTVTGVDNDVEGPDRRVTVSGTATNGRGSRLRGWLGRAPVRPDDVAGLRARLHRVPADTARRPHLLRCVLVLRRRGPAVSHRKATGACRPPVDELRGRTSRERRGGPRAQYLAEKQHPFLSARGDGYGPSICITDPEGNAAPDLARYECFHDYRRPHASHACRSPDEYLVALEAT